MKLWCRLQDAPTAGSAHAGVELVAEKGLCGRNTKVDSLAGADSIVAALFQVEPVAHVVQEYAGVVWCQA